MSEYQYYEFLALDKPLTDEQRAELRKLSSRAKITATRFVNEYNYGDFCGNPEKRLDDLAAMGEAAWKQFDDMIATKKTSEYDQGVALLRDLRGVAERQGEVETAAFSKRVLDLRAQYPSRAGLQNRLDEAGFPR